MIAAMISALCASMARLDEFKILWWSAARAFSCSFIFLSVSVGYYGMEGKVTPGSLGTQWSIGQPIL